MKKPISIHLHYFFLFIIPVALFNACDECNSIDCLPPGGPLDLRYTHNGQNALFGSNAIVDLNTISFTDLEQTGNTTDFEFRESDMSMRIYLLPGHSYVLNLGTIRKDTLQMTEFLQPRGRCCPVTIALEVLLNGETICQQNCDSVVEVEL